MPITALRSTRDFARIWFFWKTHAIITFFVIVILITLYAFSRTPIYESTAKILLLPKTNDNLVVSAGQGRTQYDIRDVDNADIYTEIELLKSHEVIKKTIEHFHQKNQGSLSGDQGAEAEPTSKDTQGELGDLEKEKAIFSAITVEPVFDANMISVSLESPHQYQVADVLNKLLEIYIQYHKQMYSNIESEGFYNDQKVHYGEKLKQARDKLKAFNKNNDLVNMEGQVTANLGVISQFTGELHRMEVGIIELEAKIKLLEEGLSFQDDQITLSREIRALPVIVELARGLVPLLIKRTEISKTFTKQSREYKQIDDQIKMLRGEIKRESVNASRSDSMDLKTLKVKRDALAKRIDLLIGRNKTFDLKQQELNALSLDVEIAEKNYLLYGTKTEDSRMYAKRNETNLSNVVIAEPAITPTKAKSPDILLAFQVSIVLGLFAAFLLPFILESMDHKIKTTDDIEQVLSLPVVCNYNELK